MAESNFIRAWNIIHEGSKEVIVAEVSLEVRAAILILLFFNRLAVFQSEESLVLTAESSEAEMISKKELKRKQPSEPGAFNEFRRRLAKKPTPALPVLHGNSVNENRLLLPNRTARKGTRHVGLPLALSSSVKSIKGLRTKDQVKFFVDDDDGHLNFDVGDILEGYTLLGFLGKGSFGRVAKAHHIETYAQGQHLRDSRGIVLFDMEQTVKSVLECNK
ncbi:hypothetical protein CEXT_641861 [Caerostris extrusa]|uniref:Protein kinase domain-containing protein n=1 Tax=Caerostris extrusa TaxID=172846 RepID=A0AAV4S1M6_CAEEX|nr:hypothetical protein CEXT_641861 [Caerostris extrusa]